MKDKYYRYKTKSFRNLKVSELVHIAESCDDTRDEEGCGNCFMCPVCPMFAGNDLRKYFNKRIHLKYVMQRKKGNNNE